MTGWTVALDWGTSSLRAWLLAPDGTTVDRRSGAQGILGIAQGDFPKVLTETVGDWIRAHPAPAIIACGMVGSRQGWQEAPYVACPAGAAEIASRIVAASAPSLPPVALVPGVSHQDRDGIPDVMRGEETQVLGALEDGREDGLFVLPGTHSKWVRVQGGRIVWLKTWMTGELFAALSSHSILGRLMEPGADDARAFSEGLGRGLAGDLSGRLFSVRTLGLFGRMPAAGLRSYLSGLLIGAELGEAHRAVGAPAAALVIGEPALAETYRRALGQAGWSAQTLGEEPTVRGLARLAAAWRSR